MPAPQRAFRLDPKYRWIGLGVLAVILLVLLVAWPYFRPASTPEQVAIEACQSAVRDETSASESARFEDVQTSNTSETLLFLGLEEVTDMAVNGYVVHERGASEVTQRFVCRTHIDKRDVTITDLEIN